MMVGGHFGRAKSGSLVRRLAFWAGQDLDVVECVRACQTCQRLLHPLPLPSRRGEMVGVDWISGLPTTAGGFYMTQNHADLLPGRARCMWSPLGRRRRRRMLAGIIRDMCDIVRALLRRVP